MSSVLSNEGAHNVQNVRTESSDCFGVFGSIGGQRSLLRLLARHAELHRKFTRNPFLDTANKAASTIETIYPGDKRHRHRGTGCARNPFVVLWWRGAGTMQTSSVMNALRFEQGLTYAAFLAQALINHDKFDEYYRSSPLSEADLVFFRKAASVPHGAVNILALGEAWCGDVYRELPTVARIAEASGI